jgi:hypothetical protein
MGRRGRPRKNRSRHRDGHIKRQPAVSPREVAAQMPHRRALGEAAIDPHAETELGRMLLRGDLGDNGDTLELAGSTYGRMWRGYLITLAGPTAIANGAGSGLSCGGCETAEERRHCRCTMRKNIFLEAWSILHQVGCGVGQEVQEVVCNDRPSGRIDLLKQGLGALAYHFGLAKGRNSYQYPEMHSRRRAALASL